MPFGGSLGVTDLYDRADFQGNLLSGNGLIEVEMKNFDLEYLR